MWPNLPFLLAASNAIPKPGGLVKWKMRLVKNVKLSLQLAEAMKIVRLTYLLPDVLCQSSPRPRLRHGRQAALLSRSNLTLNPCIFSFVLSLALLSHRLLLLICPTVPLPGVGFGLCRLPEIHFSVTHPKVLRSRAREQSSAKPRAPRSLTGLFALPSPLLNFLRLHLTSSYPLPLAQTKLPIPC